MLQKIRETRNLLLERIYPIVYILSSYKDIEELCKAKKQAIRIFVKRKGKMQYILCTLSANFFEKKKSDKKF